MCSKPSNSLILSSGEHKVSPAIAPFAPATYTMLPAGTLSVLTLSGPKYTPTCCTLDLP